VFALEENFRIKKKAAYLSLFVGIGMFLSKMGAYLITGSSAIFSDAAESVVHVMATSIALYSIILSEKPPDESHLYGHGKIEYFSAGIEGFLIILAAFTIIYSSVSDIISGYQPSKLNVGSAIIGVAGLVNLFLGFYLIKKGKSTNSLALVADGKHVLTDSYTSIGVFIGLILVMVTDFYILDPIIAIFVAINILVTGYSLIRESIGGLMNETDKEVLDDIVKLLASLRKDHWIDIHNLRYWKSADRIFVDFHLSLPFFFNIKQAHYEGEFIEEELQKSYSNSQVNVHLDYCADVICKYCNYEPCEYRKQNKSENIIWTTDRLIDGPLKLIRHDVEIKE